MELWLPDESVKQAVQTYDGTSQLVQQITVVNSNIAGYSSEDNPPHGDQRPCQAWGTAI
jgi:hypothetical protein